MFSTLPNELQDEILKHLENRETTFEILMKDDAEMGDNGGYWDDWIQTESMHAFSGMGGTSGAFFKTSTFLSKVECESLSSSKLKPDAYWSYHFELNLGLYRGCIYASGMQEDGRGKWVKLSSKRKCIIHFKYPDLCMVSRRFSERLCETDAYMSYASRTVQSALDNTAEVSDYSHFPAVHIMLRKVDAYNQMLTSTD